MQLGQALGQAGHIAQCQIRFVAAGQSRVSPAHKIVRVPVPRVGSRKNNNHIAAVGWRGEFDTEILCRLRDGLRVHPRRRPAFAPDVADRVEPPQRLLPLVDHRDKRLGVRALGGMPHFANAVEHQRPAGRGVLMKHAPQRLKIFCIQPLLDRCGLDGFPPLANRLAFGQCGSEISLKRNAAVAADHIGLGRRGVVPRVAQLPVDVYVPCVKLVDARHEFIGPVALGRLFGKTDAVR